jgi:hypothetical protein
VFFALWYLGGSLIHIKYGLTQGHIYEAFGKTCLVDFCRELWSAHIMPHITFFALLLAVFELAIGVMILSKGMLVKSGLAASVIFNLFLVLLGLGYPQPPGTLEDFLQNRFITLVFILMQLPLFTIRFDRSVPALVWSRFRRSNP